MQVLQFRAHGLVHQQLRAQELAGGVGAARWCVDARPAQPADEAVVFEIVEALSEVFFVHLEENLTGQQRIRAGLVLRSYAHNAQLVRHLLKPAVEVVCGSHQIFDIVHIWKVDTEGVQELSLTFWQLLAGQLAQQITKVVGTMKCEPGHILHQHKARGQQHLRKVARLHALRGVLVELDARVHEQVDGLLGVQVLG